ncbi:hypothetical protein GCM10023080_067070 [Streptomyces pseudoechinosporeus]
MSQEAFGQIGLHVEQPVPVPGGERSVQAAEHLPGGNDVEHGQPLHLLRAVQRPAVPHASAAVVAHDAVDLLLSAEIRRVRVCGADRCALRFLDRSPARNRRWCSMSRCGNRTKVRLHQARTRQSGRITES